MPDFTDMVARAVSPAMSREEREAIYEVVRRAVLRLQDAEGTPSDDPGLMFQQHLVEDTIRDVEAEITRYLALRRLEAGEEGSDAASG